MTTKDGYILTLHRIPSRSNTNTSTNDINNFEKPWKRSPVFLGHSVVGSSAQWTFSPNHSLAYMLADEGIPKLPVACEWKHDAIFYFMGISIINLIKLVIPGLNFLSEVTMCG